MVTAPDIDPSKGLTLKSAFVYWALTGTAAPTDTDSLSMDWNFLGDTDADVAVSFTPPGAPTRNIVQAARDGGVTWAASYQSNTDAATLSCTALEITQDNLDLLLNLERTDNYADHKGGVPDHVLVLAIGQTESGIEIGVLLPFAVPYVDGSIALQVTGTDAVMKLPAIFSGDPDPVLGFDYRLIGSADEGSI